MDRLLVIAIPFFSPIVIGFFAGRWARRPEDGLAWLNFFVIYVALPPVLFQVLSKTPFAALANLRYMAATGTTSLLAYLLTFAIALIALRGRFSEAAIAGGIGSYGNIGYMGPGMVLAALGTDAAAPMALVFAVDTVLFFTIIPLLEALGGEHADVRSALQTIATRVGLNPFILAVIAGCFVSYLGVKMPEAIDRSLDMLMVAAAPAALFLLGVTVALRPAGHLPLEMGAALVVKLLIQPVIAAVVLWVAGPFDPTWMYTAMLMASLPPALSVFVLATQFDTYQDRASTGVLVGTFASMGTLLIWLYVVEHRIDLLALFH